jgi:hypothetical protein
LGNQVQTADRDIHPPGFKRAHLRPMKARKVRKLVLRPTVLQA